MGTPEGKMLYRIIFPATKPHIFSGVRVTVPVALIIAFTAEMIAGGGGVGAALMFAQRFFQTPTVFVYILIMLATGLILDRVMLRLRHWLIPWHHESAWSESRSACQEQLWRMEHPPITGIIQRLPEKPATFLQIVP